ncbi:MAG: hypothetical protein M3Q07_19475, partial [Pseudobdellovibrionaceae bacterium]|nr:hypothetical protein [Pseudobdellovibrionaceae bacterium]
PASCDAEVTVDSAAGQKVVHPITVPVRFEKIDFKEFALKDPTKPDNVIATLTYKLSSNIKLSNFRIEAHEGSNLQPENCKLTVANKDNSIDVLADVTAEPNLSLCVSFLFYEIEVNGKKRTWAEQVAVSPYRPFVEVCEDRNAEIQRTLLALVPELNAGSDCKIMDKELRSKNILALFNDDVFDLNFSEKDVANLEPLARMFGLKNLDLSLNERLSDLRPLQSLKNLQSLDVMFTNVTDFSPIYGLSGMKEFSTDKTTVECNKSEVANAPLKNLCTQE